MIPWQALPLAAVGSGHSSRCPGLSLLPSTTGVTTTARDELRLSVSEPGLSTSEKKDLAIKGILQGSGFCSVVSNSLRPHGLLPTWLLLSIEFSRQESWSGLSFPSPGDLPHPETESTYPVLAGGFFFLFFNWRKIALQYWQIDSLSLRHLGSP